MSTTTTIGGPTDRDGDRLREVKEFDDSKVGVKGLVDSGISAIPRFFIHPPETLSDIKLNTGPEHGTDIVVPTIDLSGAIDDSGRRSEIVEQVARASRELGFFQIVNHGAPAEVLDRLIGGIKGFHEQPMEDKARWYRREMGTGVAFSSNVDLFQSKAASWSTEPESGTDIISSINLLEAMDDLGRRLEIVEQIAPASRELGFFQIVNHMGFH